MRILAAILLLLPAAAADNTAELAFAADFRSAEIAVVAPIEGKAASEMRASMDDPRSGGDGDGAVSQAEADRFVARIRVPAQQGTSSSLTNGSTTLDGRIPSGIEAMSLELANAAGPVQSNATVTMRVNATLRLAPGNGTSHELAGHRMDPAARTWVTVRAPEGWSVVSWEGAAGAQVARDARSVRFADDALGPSGYRVVLAQDGAPPPPGSSTQASPFAFPLALAALAFATWRR